MAKVPREIRESVWNVQSELAEQWVIEFPFLNLLVRGGSHSTLVPSEYGFTTVGRLIAITVPAMQRTRKTAVSDDRMSTGAFP